MCGLYRAQLIFFNNLSLFYIMISDIVLSMLSRSYLARKVESPMHAQNEDIPGRNGFRERGETSGSRDLRRLDFAKGARNQDRERFERIDEAYSRNLPEVNRDERRYHPQNVKKVNNNPGGSEDDYVDGAVSQGFGI